MKTYTIYWLSGSRQVVHGTDYADAFKNAGYGGGAVSAIDFFANGDDHSYEWKNGKWNKI